MGTKLVINIDNVVIDATILCFWPVCLWFLSHFVTPAIENVRFQFE